MPLLLSPRLALRALEPEDLALLYTIENDRALWSVSATPVPYSRYALKEYIAQQAGDIYQSGQLRLVIVRRDTQEAIGLLDLFAFSPGDLRAEVGIALLEAHRGGGLASEALELLCAYARRTLHLRRLTAYVDCDNAASLGAFLSAGFKCVAQLPAWHCRQGEWTDVQLLDCLFRAE